MAVSICASSDGATCDITSGDWSEGWITFSDLDGDAVVDGGDGDTLLSISESAYDGNTIAEVSTRDNLTFNGLGEAVVTGPVTFRVCGPEKVQSFARGE
jgi:Tfp pilus assembly protein FimT